MNAVLSAGEIFERTQAALPQAEWYYDDELDELELTLPGARGRAGFLVWLDDEGGLRLDPETLDPLSVIIMPFSSWAAKRVEGHSGTTGRDAVSWDYHHPEPRVWGAIANAVRTSKALDKLAA